MIAFLQNSWLAMLLTVVIAYLLGSISFAIIVTKLFSKQDIRDFGSGNAGATNVLRSQGKLPALLTTLGDLGKSILSVLIGGWLLTVIQMMPFSGWESYRPLMYDPDNLELVGRYLAGFFCIIGHMYPLFFGFRGGKGVMTTLGMTLLLDWRAALLLLAVFAVIVLCTRMVSFGSIIAAIGLPVATWFFRTYVDHQQWQTVAFCTVAVSAISLIVIFKHRSNIVRIFKGTENKI